MLTKYLENVQSIAEIKVMKPAKLESQVGASHKKFSLQG